MSDWHKQIAITALAGMGFAMDDVFRKQLAKKGLTISGIGLGLVGTRFAIEGAGLVGSYAIAGKQGVSDWQAASARMHDWGVIGDIPFVGAVTQLIPNPVGVGGVLFDSGKMIGEHTQAVPHAVFMMTKQLARDAIDFTDRFYNPLGNF